MKQAVHLRPIVYVACSAVAGVMQSRQCESFVSNPSKNLSRSSNESAFEAGFYLNISLS